MSYELMVRMQDANDARDVTITPGGRPRVGYRFFLSANGQYGHHMLIHKDGSFLAAVRQDGAYNLHEALVLNGGPDAFYEVLPDQPVSSDAALAFHIATTHHTRHFLVQAVVTDIARAARQEDVLHYIVKFLNKADLGVFCMLTHDGIRIMDGAREVVRVTAPRSQGLIEALGMYAALEPR
ncbi:hypothetical protein D3C87_992960 [compost metagenome]